MDINSFVIGHSKGYKKGRAQGGFLSMEENEAGGMTYELAGTKTDGAGLNITYGDVPPEDMSKLWVKTSEAKRLQIGTNRMDVLTKVGTIQSSAAGIASGTVGTKIYLFGGQINTNSSGFLRTIQEFDTETQTRTTLGTVLPTAAYYIGAAVVGTKIYLFGGKVGINAGNSNSIYTISVFDAETQTIATLDATLPTRTYGIATGVVDTKVYLFGGYNYSSKYLSTIQMFDTETQTRTTLDTVLSPAAYYIATGVVGTKIYLFGGFNSGSTISVFDAETQTIATLDTVLSPSVSAGTAGVVGTKIYLFGGSTIRVFDTETQIVTKLSTIPTISHIASGVVGTKVYVFGGTTSTSSFLNTIQMFERGKLTENHLHMTVSLETNLFELLPNVVTGVDSVSVGDKNNESNYVEAYLYKNGEWTLI